MYLPICRTMQRSCLRLHVLTQIRPPLSCPPPHPPPPAPLPSDKPLPPALAPALSLASLDWPAVSHVGGARAELVLGVVAPPSADEFAGHIVRCHFKRLRRV